MNESVVVKNRSAGIVVYKVPEMNVRRQFNVGERKTIPVKELEALSQQAGGNKLLYHYLFVEDQEVLRYLINGEESIEYWLTPDKIPGWINTCSIDEFKDALDFAPEGIKDLIKKLAIDLPLNDYSKRQAIHDQLGFDVNKAIELLADDEPKKDAEKAPEAPKAVGRRSTSSSIQAPVVAKPAVVAPK